jgi:hypothetical protein
MANSVSFNTTRPMVEVPSQFQEVAEDLSPDALMSYCQARLDSIDGQVKSSFDAQQRNASATNKIDQMIASLKLYDGSDQTDPSVCKQLETQFQGLIKSLKETDPGCPVLPSLTQAYNSMVWSGDGGSTFTHSTNPDDPDFIDNGKYPPMNQNTPQGDNKIGTQELQGYVQTLTDAASDLNSNTELGMVQLQSLMSQRQTAVTLTTNLVQSLGDQENKIADNIGH